MFKAIRYGHGYTVAQVWCHIRRTQAANCLQLIIYNLKIEFICILRLKPPQPVKVCLLACIFFLLFLFPTYVGEGSHQDISLTATLHPASQRALLLLSFSRLWQTWSVIIRRDRGSHVDAFRVEAGGAGALEVAEVSRQEASRAESRQGARPHLCGQAQKHKNKHFKNGGKCCLFQVSVHNHQGATDTRYNSVFLWNAANTGLNRLFF